MALRAVDTGRVRAIGTVVNRGRQTALAEARLVDAKACLLAHATSSCMLFPVPASATWGHSTSSRDSRGIGARCRRRPAASGFSNGPPRTGN
ncbi:hypothetical protein SUDANB105_07795 [Streptomyces sp. enrichment culture]